MGSFWEAEDFFSSLKGVIKTRVGYCGGIKENPSYHNLGDHSESVEITFDPKKITYSELLDRFWGQHDPCAKRPIQYWSAVFTLGRDQYEIARQSKKNREKASRENIKTVIKPACFFYPAEKRHQGYLANKKSNHCQGKQATMPRIAQI